MRNIQIEKELLNLLKGSSFKELSDLINKDFIHINDDRGYISIDVNNERFREDTQGQTFIFTAEGYEAKDFYDEEEDNDFIQFIAWSDNHGQYYGQDLESCIEHVQRIALSIHAKYE